MATNPASYNPIGEETGPATDPPPPLPESTKAAIADAAKSSATGSHVPGQDAPPKMKTEKELERERKKAEKQAIFEQRQAEKAAKAAAAATVVSKKKLKAQQKAQEDGPPPSPYRKDTPLGEKPILPSLDDPRVKAYDPIGVEAGWYSWWEKEGFFKPEFTADGKVKPEGSFVIALPPPNVTGALHMGHALGNSLQDILIRLNRMQGKTTLWLPGCDHAGIATQNVVEKKLALEFQKTRHDIGRPEFIKLCWKWKEDYHRKINNAQRRMGSSLDWSREAFTMNETFTEAVTETFVRLHEEKLIYRDTKLVNWCTILNTALSKLEVDNVELKGRTLIDVPGYDRKVEFGVIIHFKYEIEGSDKTIEVATTRIETMLGDSGIAVHPDDKRYAHLVGKTARHPFIKGRLLPIIADEYVEMDFGTGAVKLTPAHDENDYKLGKKHNLEFINILTDDGLMNENAGPYVGQKRFDVRYKIQEDLKKAGLYVDKKDNPMLLPICSRSKDVIEPRIKPQWYMKMKDMAKQASEVVESGELKILPKTAEKSYLHWMSIIDDWCLSRQLWWGHQAPMYLAHIDGEARSNDADGDLWFSGRTQEEAEAKAKASKTLSGKAFTLERDEDVLDTWFSSGLWPFATLGWPNTEAPDFKKLFPTSLLETGEDILFFWIARMVMFSLKLTGKVPFTEVYCHSMVRDSDRKKMSKSLGNVIDPLDLIEGIELETLNAKLLTGNLAPAEVERATKYQKTAFPKGIPQCGTDAMRFALANQTGSTDIALEPTAIYGWRKFCNKIYQATKYVLLNLPPGFQPQESCGITGSESLPESWILHSLETATKDVERLLAARQFSKATDTIYRYWLSELCDVYIENSKPTIRDGTDAEKLSTFNTLYTAIEGGLTMLHPFMPYLTEELWQRIPRRHGDKTPSITIAKYPVYGDKMLNPEAAAKYSIVLSISSGIRSFLGEKASTYEGTVSIGCLSTLSNIQLKAIKALIGKGITLVTLTKPPTAKCRSSSIPDVATLYIESEVEEQIAGLEVA